VLGNWGELREDRIGVMLHYDGSASDPGAVYWLTKDPACKVSYNTLVLDDGKVVQVAPDDKRAWHAGVCRPSDPRMAYRDANSAFYGISIAAKPGDAVPLTQWGTLLRLVVERFQKHGWPLTDTWRLTSHHLEAWPRGRKSDIQTLVDIEEIRAWLSNAR
jgi:N-acetyl-anhydromuramyl-L-alanine amidase AmpD